MTKKKPTSTDALPVEAVQEIVNQFAALEDKAAGDPVGALNEVRQIISANFGLGSLPLKPEASRVQFANNLLAQWLLYCAEDYTDVPGEIDQLIQHFKILKTIHADNDQRYLSIIKDCNEGMTRRDVLMKYDLPYSSFIQQASSATTESEQLRWQAEADAQAVRFWDNLRKAEDRMGVRRKNKHIGTSKRRSKYKTSKGY